MSIEKKSLISTLRTTKKANLAKEEISLEHLSKSAVVKAQPVTKTASKAKAVAKAVYKMQAAAKLARK